MKRFYKIIAAILLCSMLVCMLFGCDNQNTESKADVSVNIETSTGDVFEDASEDVSEDVTVDISEVIDIEGVKYSPSGDGTYAEVVDYIGSELNINIASKYEGLPVKHIAEHAFYGCTSLTSITIPDSVTSIGEGAFEGCTNLTRITLPDNVTSIGPWVFAECITLTNITLSNSVTRIDKGAFNCCESLTSITIPDSVTRIDYGAFEYCTSLTSITIPNSVTSIGDDAFQRCDNLKDIYYSGTKEEWANIDIGINNYYFTDATIHYNA